MLFVALFVLVVVIRQVLFLAIQEFPQGFPLTQFFWASAGFATRVRAMKRPKAIARMTGVVLQR